MVTPTPEMAMQLDHVSKTYGRRFHALRGIRMEVRRGEVFGLLGPNGAGKSTLVKIVMTVVRPTRAHGTVLGRPVGHKPTLARIGYLPENHRFPPYLTAVQALEYYAALAKVDRRTRKRRAGELLERVGLADRAHTRLSTFSKGMLQRLGIAQALVHDPELILLDEPTDGLDPVGRRDTRELLKQLRAQGKTVFLNSHLLGEVECVCDRVAILVEGLVVHQGTVDDLTARSRYYEIELDCPPPQDFAATVRAALPPSVAMETSGGTIRILTSEAAVVQPVVDALRHRGIVLRSLRPVRQSLEDFFIQAVAKPPAGGENNPGVPA